MVECVCNLHSTMYLLNLLTSAIKGDALGNLHSTMYLLNLWAQIHDVLVFLFTFHYVSIKSPSTAFALMKYTYLHSTMYLLNRGVFWEDGRRNRIFTFHYVSIKSRMNEGLKPCPLWFTFHYVSIKSRKQSIQFQCLR